jgi:pyruvate/2-oxoglutarate dehydrogenase complex dihydrolipoamide dehydrogenase (E3) component
MARQLIADPATPNKATEGRDDDIRYCIGGNDSCIFQVAHEQQIRCDHNPAAGRERLFSERLLTVVAEPKDIVVVGGGPAGMKAAEILARRGHRVSLFEKQTRLGGQVLLAQEQPYHVEIFDVVDYLERALRRLGVEVHLGVEITEDLLDEIEADALILATGSRPALSQIAFNPAITGQEPTAGLDHFNSPAIRDLDPQVLATVDEVLSGDHAPGKRAVVIDGTGNWEGAGTAEFLANAGSEVWVVTGAFSVGSSLEAANRHLFYQRAAEKSIHTLTTTAFAGFADGVVHLKNIYTSESTEISGVDLVVPAVGRRSDEALFLDWKKRAGQRAMYRLGDCVAPRMLREVIRESYEFAMNF